MMISAEKYVIDKIEWAEKKRNSSTNGSIV